jgi:hypothetical protein
VRFIRSTYPAATVVEFLTVGLIMQITVFSSEQQFDQ